MKKIHIVYAISAIEGGLAGSAIAILFGLAGIPLAVALAVGIVWSANVVYDLDHKPTERDAKQ